MNKDEQALNELKALAIESIQKAKSGHPGVTLSGAEILYALYFKNLKFNPKNPKDFNRDRVVLSAGHVVPLVYSFLTAFSILNMNDMQNLRQLGSKTPGHPEVEFDGIDCSTGPLGQGVANAVGMAIAESILNDKFKDMCNHYTYCFMGDGCLQEGVALEAISLAGHLKLNKLIFLYDKNDITLDDKLNKSNSEDVKAKFLACNFDVIEVEKGNSLEDVDKAIKSAKKNEKPTIIIFKTTIGRESVLENTSKVHGSPLGEEEVSRLKKLWQVEENFEFSNQTKEYFDAVVNQKIEEYEKCEENAKLFEKQNPKLKKELKGYFEKIKIPKVEIDTNEMATRDMNAIVVNELAKTVPNLISLSADLFSSTKTKIKDGGDYSADNRTGRNIYVGIREHAMGALANGICLHGGLRVLCSTFLTFSNYIYPALRMAAIMKLPVVYAFTHDSIAVGEDGPSHQPIEQLDALRIIPNFDVWRPCNLEELLAGWQSALNADCPTALALTRQKMQFIKSTIADASCGGYVYNSASRFPNGVLIASGSEVELCLKAQELLKQKSFDVNVISVPSLKTFLEQKPRYQKDILSNAKSKLAVEMGTGLSYYKIVGSFGQIFNVEKFGRSGKAEDIIDYFGFTKENIATSIENLMKENGDIVQSIF